MSSQSELLRQRQTRDGGGRSINNEEAKSFDMKLKTIIPTIIIPLLRKKYPYIEWTHITKIHQRDYAIRINPNYVATSNNPFISPDGGIILANGNPVLISEAKKQGTNNQRISQGLPRQALGNAIERAFKNFSELQNYMFDKDYFPYLVFVYGSDFAPGSSILSRLHSMVMYKNYNNIYVLDNPKIASVFVQTDPYSDDFIIEKCMETVDIVVRHLNMVQ